MYGSPGPGTGDAVKRGSRGAGKVSLASPFSRLAKLRRVLRRGEIAFRRGDLVLAERSGRWVLDRLSSRHSDQATLRPGEREALIAAGELVGCVRRELTDFVGASDMHREALTMLDSTADEPQLDHSRLAVLGRLGETLRLLGHFAEAEDHLVRAVRLSDQFLPADPVPRADALNGLGILFKDTQRFAEAGDHYRQALELLEQSLGPEDLQLAAIYHNLAGLEHAQDRFVEGEPHARRALHLRAQHEGLTTTGAAADLGVLGALLLGQRRYPEAELVLGQSLAIWQAKFGPQHYEVAVAQHNLAALYAARGEQARALRTLTQVLDTKKRILGTTHPDVTALRRHIERYADTSPRLTRPSHLEAP